MRTRIFFSIDKENQLSTMSKPSTNLFWNPFADNRPTCNWKVAGDAYFLKYNHSSFNPLDRKRPGSAECPSEIYYAGEKCMGQHIHMATSGATRTYSNQADCMPEKTNEVVMWKPLTNKDGTPNLTKCTFGKNANAWKRSPIQCGSCYRYPARSGHTFNCKS